MSKNVPCPENSFLEIVDNVRNVIKEQFNTQLLGQILTVVDGAITNPQQNKAVKDLIKSRVYVSCKSAIEILKEYIYWHAEKNGQPIKQDQTENF